MYDIVNKFSNNSEEIRITVTGTAANSNDNSNSCIKYRSSHRTCSEIFENTYFEEHLRMTASANVRRSI